MSQDYERLDQLDPHPGEGDVQYKKKLLGGMTVANGLRLPGTSTEVPYGGGVDFEGSGESYRGGVEGNVGAGTLEVVTGLRVSQGSYEAHYKEAAGEDGKVHSEHGISARGLRHVSVDHLPKHERKAQSNDDKVNETKRRHHNYEGKFVEAEPNPERIGHYPVGIKEKDKKGYREALRSEFEFREQSAIESRRRYPITIKNEKKARRVAEIVNKKVAKDIADTAKAAREKINEVDLGD